VTLSAAQYNTLKNVYSYGFTHDLALFDRIDPANFTGMGAVGYAMATFQSPVALVSPPYSRTPVGVPVTLYGGDSIERGGTAASGHTWSLESGSAILSPAGTQCTVTPTGANGEIVVVKLTVTATNSQTNDRYAYIYTGSWNPGAVDSFNFAGSYDAHGWSGELRLTDRTADFDGLEPGKLILFHMVPYFNGVASPIGGYKRAENLCLLRVGDYAYSKATQTVTIPLESPAEELDRKVNYSALSEHDGDHGMLRYWLGSSDPTGGDEYRYRADLAMSDAAWDIMAGYLYTPAQYYNCTIWDDPNSFQRFTVNMGSFRQQLIDVMASQLGYFFCNYTGSVQCVPDRVVRADEYWAAPNPVFGSSAPLTQDFAFNEGDSKAWKAQYYEAKYSSIKLVGQQFNDDGVPVDTTILYGDEGDPGKQQYVKSGVYIPDYNTGLEWCYDLLAQANREWDLDWTMLGSNALNVADDFYVYLEPDPAGLATIGLDNGYIKEVRHTVTGLNTPNPQWLTSCHAEQITTG